MEWFCEYGNIIKNSYYFSKLAYKNWKFFRDKSIVEPNVKKFKE